MRCVEVSAKVAPVAAENGAGDGLDQQAIRLADQIRAQQVRAARSVLPHPPRPVVEQRGELRMDVVEITRRVLVDNDDVGAHPFQAPVLLCLQHLAHERHVRVCGDTHEENRQIAGDPVRPQTGLAELVRRDDVRARAQRAVGEKRSRRETLELQRLVARDAQVAQTALRMSKGEGECPRRRARIAVLLRERLGGLAVRGDARRETEAD